MSFIEEQGKKEVAAAKKVWHGILVILVIFWGFMGLAMLASPAWFVGLIFIGAAAYVYYRIHGKSNNEENK